MPRRRRVGGISRPFVIFEMDPDEEQIKHDIMLLEKNVKGYDKPLFYSKQVIIDDQKKTFRLERDPITGKKWQRLSDRAERVPRYGMLQRRITRRRMYRSVTAKNNYGISNRGVWFNQRTLPEYAGLHQQDEKGNMPTNITISKEAIQKRGMEMIAQHKKLSAFERRQNPLGSGQAIMQKAAQNLFKEAQEAAMEGQIPQRRFMGLSALGHRDIVNLFEDWASDAIIIYKRGGRLVRARRATRAS